MKYLLSLIRKMPVLSAGLLCFSAVLFSSAAAKDYSRAELKSITEEQLRNYRARYNRLLDNELLDEQARFYYDGEDVYPAIVINGLIFPAVVNGSQRIPGCVAAKKVLPGKYDKEEQIVICELQPAPQEGKTALRRTKATGGNRSGGAPKPAKPAKPPKPAKPAKPRARQAAAGAGAKLNLAVKQTQPGQGRVLEVNGYIARPRFGVRAGSWAKVLLPRTVSSSEVSAIELELIEDLAGLHKNIPAGTVFFADHRVNPSTQRLDMLVHLMVLPDGTEHQISASIHSLSRAAGLLGAVITHSDKAATIAAKKGLLDGTKNNLRGGQDPAAELAGGVATEVINSETNSLPVAPNYSVQVASQEALIRFGRSF